MSCLSVCLCVIRIIAKIITVAESLKLDVMFEPTSWKNRLTFGSDPVPGVDSGSLFNFHFPHYCRMGHFMRLAFLVQSQDTFHKSRRNN